MTTKNKNSSATTLSTKTAPAKKSLGARKSPATAAPTAPAPAPTAAVAGETTTAPEDLGTVVNGIMSFLDGVEEKLGPEPVVTTSTQKRRIAKPRKGADKVLPVIASIVQQHGLDSTSLSSKTVMDAYTTAQTLVPLQTRLQKMSKRVGDTAFGAQTDSWAMGLQLYSMLKRRAKTDGQVAAQIAPLAHVFSYRHPLVKAEKPTKRQTQVKAEVKHVTALAEKHGVPFGSSVSAGSSGASASSGGGSASAVGTGGAQAPVTVPVVAPVPVVAQAPVASAAPVVVPSVTAAVAPVAAAAAAPPVAPVAVAPVAATPPPVAPSVSAADAAPVAAAPTNGAAATGAH